MVERDQPGGEPRFFMLETIREFARELLAGSDEAHAIHDSHSRCFALLADQDAERLTADEKAAWFERLDQESANLSAALDWAIARADIQLGIPLILALCEIQWNRVRTIEAQSQIAAVLSWLDLSAQPAKHIRLLQWAFAFARIQGDFDGARALGLQALEIARAMGEPNQVASTLSLLGDLAYREGDNAAARRLLEEALAIQRGRGKPAELASTLLSLAMTLYLDGELDQAQVPIKEDIDIQRDIGPTAELGSALQPYAWILTDQGQFTAARDCLREARSVFERVHMGTGLLWTVEGTARLAAARGEAELAVRLAGATRSLRQTMHVPLPQSIQLDFDHHLATCREQLGETAFRAAWDDGAHLTYEEATAEASAYLDRT
ncbi:MAG TPA: tetratricopeptide repeat protein [Thermomicrobiaceae bacterium]|nr:tetratricopeptide repeat protein [Thermomicrobiaceae bacterium]